MLLQHSNGASPLSLRQIADLIGVSTRWLRVKYPEICDIISCRFRAEIKRKSDLRVQELCSLVEETTKQLLATGIYPSRRKVESELKRPGLLREKAIQQAWKAALGGYVYEETEGTFLFCHNSVKYYIMDRAGEDLVILS